MSAPKVFFVVLAVASILAGRIHAQAPGCTTSFLIQFKQNLGQIAAIVRSTPRTLMELNPTMRTYMILVPGTTLVVPCYSATPSTAAPASRLASSSLLQPLLSAAQFVNGSYIIGGVPAESLPYLGTAVNACVDLAADNSTDAPCRDWVDDVVEPAGGLDDLVPRLPSASACFDLQLPWDESMCGRCMQVASAESDKSVVVRVIDHCTFQGVILDPVAYWSIAQGQDEAQISIRAGFVEC
ncbi:hypothetical protein H632_c868p0 [Helicosporidium sp. ATCC 50920]|nr:hypothetical protein H632_c868p0 [Helicosporidium sp. ATCC 50920]|eukprot:KDD75105.1 hypothetical protein H632_c868p0 [Helicosporidium sp. ATCC 50920]